MFNLANRHSIRSNRWLFVWIFMIGLFTVMSIPQMIRAAEDEVIYKDVWADWESLVETYGSHENARIAAKGIDTQYEKYRVAKNNGKDSDYPSMVKYSLYSWTDAWAYFNWGKYLVTSLQDITDKNLTDQHKAQLKTALKKFDDAVQTAISARGKIVPTKNYTIEDIEQRIDKCIAACDSFKDFTEARLGKRKYND